MKGFAVRGRAPSGGGFGQPAVDTNATAAAPVLGFGSFGQSNTEAVAGVTNPFGQTANQSGGSAPAAAMGGFGSGPSTGGFAVGAQSTSSATQPAPVLGQTVLGFGATPGKGEGGNSVVPTGVGAAAAPSTSAAPTSGFSGFGSGAKTTLNPFGAGFGQASTTGTTATAPSTGEFGAATSAVGQTPASGATPANTTFDGSASNPGNTGTNPTAGTATAVPAATTMVTNPPSGDTVKAGAPAAFGGFGATPPTSGSNPSAAPTPFAGFGAGATAPTNPASTNATAGAATTGGGPFSSITKPSETGGNAPPATAGAGGAGLGPSLGAGVTGGNQSAGATGTVGAGDPTAISGKQASLELRGKMLSTILAQFDKAFSKDYRDFSELSQLMMLRDRQIIERGNEILSHSSHLEEAIANADVTRQTLIELKNKQAAIGTMLQRFEDAVQPIFAQVRPTFNSVDEAREETYTAVINLFDEVETLKLRLQQCVRQHNGSVRHLRQSDDLAKFVGLIDCQLSAMEVCAAQASELEREVDLLLGKSTIA